MARTLRALALTALMAQAVGSGAAVAAVPEHWFSFHTKELTYFGAVDATAATQLPTTDAWRFDVGGPAWPATITTRTTIAPSQLAWSPPIAPTVDGGLNVFTRNGTAGSMFTVVRAVPVSTEGAMRVATRRELVEGRAVPGGSPVSKTLRIDVTPAETGRVLSVAALFASPAGPIAVANVSCPGARADHFGPGSFVWDVRPPVPGTTSRFECTFLANTSGGPGTYMPQVEATLLQGPDPLVGVGATRFAFTSDPIGTTELAVTPPAGTDVVGHLDQWEERRTVLLGENRGTPVSRWTGLAVSTARLNTSGDSVADAPQAFTKEWTDALFVEPFSTKWPGEIGIATGRAGLAFFPTPTTTTGTERIWSTTTNGLQPRIVDGTATETPGFSLSRSISGGRQVDPGPASSRTLTVDLATSRAFADLQLAITFRTNGPVTPSAISCTPASTDPTTGQMNWFPSTGAASTFRVTCTYSATNGATTPALYAPDLFVSAIATREDTQLAAGATTGSLENDLGTHRFSVTPPSGTSVQGTLRRIATTLVSLDGEDRAIPVRDWTASLSRVYSTNVSGDLLSPDVQPLTPSWGFTVMSSETWPATVDLTTALTPSELRTFPSMEPTPVEGGFRYSWHGSTPFFSVSAVTPAVPIDADLGFGASRSISDGRRILAGTTVTREIVLRARTTVPMLSLSIAIEPGVAIAGVTVSDVACPGSEPIGGSPLGRAWRIDAPTVGTEYVRSCSVRVANGAAQDLLYAPWVNYWSSRSFTSGPQVLGSTRLELSTELLGTIAFSVEPPQGALVRGRTSIIDIRIATLDREARLVRRATSIEVLSGGTHTFGFEPEWRARLIDELGLPVVDRLVRFDLRRPDGSSAFPPLAVRTDSTGIARLARDFSSLPGEYTLVATFDGDETYLSSNDADPYRIVNSIGKVTGGSIRDANNGRGGFNVHSDGTALKGEFQFQSDTVDYHASDVRGLGISADGRRAVFAVVTTGGIPARVTVEDNGEGAGTVDRIEVRISRDQQNADGRITGGTVQIHVGAD